MSISFTNTTISQVFKDLYSNYFRDYHDVTGAKEELLKRITSLTDAEKAILGIEETDKV